MSGAASSGGTVPIEIEIDFVTTIGYLCRVRSINEGELIDGQVTAFSRR